MTLNIAQEGIEIGIVTRDVGPMLKFYRDILGLEFERELLMANGMHMTRLKCGPNIIKLVVNPKEPKADAPRWCRLCYRVSLLDNPDYQYR